MSWRKAPSAAFLAAVSERLLPILISLMFDWWALECFIAISFCLTVLLLFLHILLVFVGRLIASVLSDSICTTQMQILSLSKYWHLFPFTNSSALNKAASSAFSAKVVVPENQPVISSLVATAYPAFLSHITQNCYHRQMFSYL